MIKTGRFRRLKLLNFNIAKKYTVFSPRQIGLFQFTTMFWILFISLLALVPHIQGSDLCKNNINATILTASSEMAPNDKTKNYGADRAGINTTETVDANGVTQMGGWVAEKVNLNQWIQIELNDVSLIRGLVTQGRNGCCKEWVTKYRVLYSEDCKNWTTVGGFNVTDAFFKANTDQDTAVTNLFHCPVMAKCIRINPLGWNKNIAMRVGLLGCSINLNSSASTTTSASMARASSSLSTMTSPMPSTKSTQQTAKSNTSKQQTTKSVASKPTSSPSVATTSTVKAGPTQKSGGPGKCVKSCKGMANGDYQSCAGCGMYITCNWGKEYDKRPCPMGTVWDDSRKKCDWASPTCP